MRKLDLKGKNFGRLVVLRESGKDSRGNITWLVQCNHGGKSDRKPVRKVLAGSHLRYGGVRSCGCLLLESSSRNGKKCRRHGMYRHPLYQVWRNMKYRCLDPSRKDYKYYGGRGIGICDEWMKSDNFFAWAKSSRYRSGLTIERRNTDADYSPSNCYWATRKEQIRNRRCTQIVLFRGKRKPLIEHCEDIGVSYALVSNRIWYGWSAVDALTQPIDQHRRRHVRTGGVLKRK